MSYGTVGADSAQEVGTDGAGNVYVAGNVAGTQSAIDTDISVAKYYANGTPAWKLQIGVLTGISPTQSRLIGPATRTSRATSAATSRSATSQLPQSARSTALS